MKLIAKALCLAVCAAPVARAADDVSIGKAVETSFAFTTLDIGIAAGIFQSEGLNVSMPAFRGDAVLQQAMASGSVDFGLGSGPAMGFHVKGAPAPAIAVIAGPPYNMSLCVPVKGGVQGPQELRGKRIGFTTVGSLTDWLVRETSRQEGWGSDGIKGMALGPNSSSAAAVRSGQADGFVSELASCLQLQHDGAFRVLVNFGDRIKQFYTHVMFARQEVIDTRPDVVRRVLRAWFRTIAFMRANKAPSMVGAQHTMGLSEGVASETYDKEIAMMSDDGAFDQPTLQIVAASLKELGILDEVPPTSALYDGRFVPVKLP